MSNENTNVSLYHWGTKRHLYFPVHISTCITHLSTLRNYSAMPTRSGSRRLPFDILTIAQNNDNFPAAIFSSTQDDTVSSPSRKKKKKRNRKGKTISDVSSLFSENSVPNGQINNYSCTVSRTITEEVESELNCVVRAVTPQFPELRQRNVGSVINGGETVTSLVSEESGSGRKEDNAVEGVEEKKEGVGNEIESDQWMLLKGGKLQKEMSLDWKKLMAEDSNYTSHLEKSPMKYFMEEMNAGNSLRSTTTPSNDKERERVYDTIFRLPWRCELLINIGFFVCFDSFLSLLTIMPTRVVMTIWRLVKTRQFERPSSAELSDFGCFVVLVTGVTLLHQADISLIYHMIRGQGIIKLYVVYNVLEIFDKLCQSFVGDVMQALFNSADGLANCSQENMRFWLQRFILDEALAVVSSIVHSFILLAQAVTLSTCIVAHNNALFAMLVSNNFAEIKSNVFKRYSKDNLHSMVYFDSIERFHISAFLLFVLAQNILEAEGPWFESFITNALVVYFCEVLIDIIKHSFIAKFNDIKPIAFSEFLEDLCRQTLNIQTENAKKNLTFVPLAPACVVIRVLRPVYAAHLPFNPLPWRLFWIFLLFSITVVMLVSLKLMIGMGLQKHAKWYFKRCQKRKLHSD
ncbi:protein POLLEN DEFECTIVE IN GUIDANCE 1 [Dorcoceras hygrometricum]|uniref:Protein POLLEN DEFECTIVE IN GUIDANCE 1 n=1 Tax=Dorcoceras hygrometricum TaxID=472368 RepID=A0A2Z7AD21_9LAMI|nr:protein POLLEN DEFECTIVE IN GUIDANCE 1 [Dorcoceras hygrometricum]